MTTRTPPIAAAEGAARILQAIRPHLPASTTWTLEEDDDNIYRMVIYWDHPDQMLVWESAGPIVGDLLLEGIPFAIIFDTTDSLRRLPAGIEKRDVNWNVEAA
jgi:hypothetical protein